MFVRIWRFRAAPGREQEFEAAYGPFGEWARFFARGAGYRGTDLLDAVSGAGEYLTIDCWESQEAWEAFHRAHRAEYDELDRRCGAFTIREDCIGDFIDTAPDE